MKNRCLINFRFTWDKIKIFHSLRFYLLFTRKIPPAASIIAVLQFFLRNDGFIIACSRGKSWTKKLNSHTQSLLQHTTHHIAMLVVKYASIRIYQPTRRSHTCMQTYNIVLWQIQVRFTSLPSATCYFIWITFIIVIRGSNPYEKYHQIM